MVGSHGRIVVEEKDAAVTLGTHGGRVVETFGVVGLEGRID